MEFSHALQEKFKDLGSRFWTSHLSVSGAFSFMISIWRQFFGGSFWMRFFHAPTLPAVSRKRKGASGLRAHQQQLGINQVFECFSTLLAKMRIVKGIGALGREIPSCQASASISSTWRTAGLDNKNPRCNWGPMQLKHQNDFQSQNLKSIQPTSPKLWTISFEGSWLSAAITSLILTGPCETRRPNDWRSFPAPLALWLHEALPSFQDSSLCRESRIRESPMGQLVFFVDNVQRWGRCSQKTSFWIWENYIYRNSQVDHPLLLNKCGSVSLLFAQPAVSASSQLYTLMPPIGQFRQQ